MLKVEWTTILSAEQISALHAATAMLDPRFAREQHAFYVTRTANQLKALRAGAWDANDREGYVLAGSYLSIAEA